MSFESGSLSFRIFWYQDALGEEALGDFKAAIAPEISTLGASPICGWIGRRHLLDRDMSPENCYFQPWLHLVLMQAEKKIPPALLKAYCRLEEEAERKARGLEFLPRKLKAEVKERVTESLLPEMPPSLSGISAIANLSSSFVYADAVSPAAAEVFARHFSTTSSRNLVRVDPAGAAMLRRRTSVRDLEPAVFTPDESAIPPLECDLGLEFLTWLWFRWERKGGAFEHAGERCEYMLEGPVTFFNEGKGAHNVVLSNGMPLQSIEAGAALRCGKKVSKIKLTLTDSEKAWTVAVDSTFAFRSLKLPKDKDSQKPSIQERMELVEKFLALFMELFDEFLDLRLDGGKWENETSLVRDWVVNRAESKDGAIGA